MTVRETAPPDVLAALATLVEARSGLRFVGGRHRELATKLTRAFTQSGCVTWQAYQTRLASASGAALFDQLIELLTVGETYFYRHRPYFDLLEREVLPEIIVRRREAKQLRLWCAGCATGEEAYSLAIAVRRVLPDIEDWHVTILATDLNGAFLARAQAAVYSEWSFRETDAAFKSAYFVADGRHLTVRAEVRKLVRFAPLNLAEDAYPSSVGGTAALDLIFCRNVLLYFAPQLGHQVVGRLWSALVPGGWLVLGPSDPRPGLLADFEMHAGDGAVVYRRADRDGAESRPIDCLQDLAGRRHAASDEGDHPLVGSVISLGESAEAPAWTPLMTAVSVAAKESQSAPIALTESDSADWRESWMAARASADEGEMEQAEAHCQQAMIHGPLRPEPYYLHGALCQARGDDAASLAAFRKSLYVDPTFVPALLAQAALHRRSGATDRARQALVRAQRLLADRQVDELVLAEEGLTVGRLKDAVVQALADTGLPE